MYQNFIGIDIGKDEFYVAVHPEETSHRFSNNARGFEDFYQHHQAALANALVALETTGGYEMALIRFLQQHNIAVHRANPLKVKHFIRSLGRLGKSDSIDAIGLAGYAAERHQKLELFVENPYKALTKLVRRRIALKQLVTKEKNRLQAPEQDELFDSFNDVLELLEQVVEKIDERIKALYDAHPILKQKCQVMKTVDGIGDVVASQLIALLPELGQADRKQIASLAAVAPHPNESGRKVGYRHTRGGRNEVKSILFVAAMAASRSRGTLGDFYRKLVAAGKKKMVALVALMRKIVVIANARVRDFLCAQDNLVTE